MGETVKLPQRIKEARIQAGLTQSELAERLGVTQQAVSGWEAGNRRPDYDVLEKLADLCGVSVDYLLGRTDDPRPVQLAQFGIEGAIPLVPIPILGSIHAGAASWASQIPEGWTGIPVEMAKRGEHFALRVKGDCMDGGAVPIKEGWLVLVRAQDYVNPGQIAVVLWPDQEEAQLRRVYPSGRNVILTADNPRYGPITVNASDIRILGVVVGFQGHVAEASATIPVRR